jgi:hypothetical protein
MVRILIQLANTLLNHCLFLAYNGFFLIPVVSGLFIEFTIAGTGSQH